VCVLETVRWYYSVVEKDLLKETKVLRLSF